MLGSQPNHSRQLHFPLLFNTDGSDFSFYDGSDLSIDEMVGAWCFFAVVRATGVYLLDFFFSGLQFMYC